MYKFIETHFTKTSTGQIDNLNMFVSVKEIESINKNFLNQKAPGQMVSLVNSA